MVLRPRCHDRICEADLAVELECSCLNRKRSGGRSGLRRLIDNSHPHAEAGKPKSQHQACRARADDEDVCIVTR